MEQNEPLQNNQKYCTNLTFTCWYNSSAFKTVETVRIILIPQWHCLRDSPTTSISHYWDFILLWWHRAELNCLLLFLFHPPLPITSNCSGNYHVLSGAWNVLWRRGWEGGKKEAKGEKLNIFFSFLEFIIHSQRLSHFL